MSPHSRDDADAAALAEVAPDGDDVKGAGVGPEELRYLGRWVGKADGDSVISLYLGGGVGLV